MKARIENLMQNITNNSKKKENHTFEKLKKKNLKNRFEKEMFFFSP